MPTRKYGLTFLALMLWAFILRFVPELMMGSIPAGFDSVAFYPSGIQNLGFLTLAQTLKVAPLFLMLIYPWHAFLHFNVLFLLKIAAPLLFTCLACTWFIFLRKYGGFSPQWALLGTLLFISQPVTLRIAWDLFRNELGIVFFLLALCATRMTGKYKLVAMSSLTFLTLLSHQIVGAILLITLFPVLIGVAGWKARARMLVAFAPTLAYALYLLAPPWYVSGTIPRTSALDYVNPIVSPLTNELVSDPLFFGKDSIVVASYVLALFLFAFGPILALVIRGIRREPRLLTLTLTLLLFSFWIVFFPQSAIPMYWRWQLMLVIPFSLFAVEGMKKILAQPRARLFTLILVGLLMIGGIGYSTGYASYIRSSLVWPYLPSSLAQSSLDAENVTNTIAATQWLNQNAIRDSVVLINGRFYSSIVPYLSPNLKPIDFLAEYPLSRATNSPNLPSNVPVYFIWFTGQIQGWKLIHVEKTIGVYELVI